MSALYLTFAAVHERLDRIERELGITGPVPAQIELEEDA